MYRRNILRLYIQLKNNNKIFVETELIRSLRDGYLWSVVTNLVINITCKNIGARYKVSGVIAANSQLEQGMLGVAPNAKILPVRVFGLDGRISYSAIIEAIGAVQK